MSLRIAIPATSLFCLVTAILTATCMQPKIAGYAGMRIGRLCFYNGVCSGAVGASVLIYQQGEGFDLYFQPCGAMVENEATYLGGSQTFGFGKNFQPSRTWVCLPSWIFAVIWAVPIWGSSRRARRMENRQSSEQPWRWFSQLILPGLASVAVFFWSPMLSITILNWLSILLFFKWTGAALRHLRNWNLARQSALGDT